MKLHINDILTGLPVTPHSFNMNYLYLLPWEIMEIIWYYLPITTKIRTKKKYYERYHYLIYKNIRFFDLYMRDIIQHRCRYVFKLIVSECYIKWTNGQPYYHLSGNFDSYMTNILAICDAKKNPEFKRYLIYFNKEIAENKLNEREIYKDYSFLHNIRNIWREDSQNQIIQVSSIEKTQ
jgi:hypothetical protein